MPRYILPPDLPHDVQNFEAIMLPMAWSIVRALSGGEALTLKELRDCLDVAPSGLPKRLEYLEAVGVVLVLPQDLDTDERRGHLLRYRLDAQRLNQIITAWRAYLDGENRT